MKTNPLKAHHCNMIPQDGELYLYSYFIDCESAVSFYQSLSKEIPWQQYTINIFGKIIQQPRLISWHTHTSIAYKYSGIKVEAQPWTQSLLTIKRAVEDETEQKFNSAFLNFYRNGNEYMGWHRDNEKILGPNPTIASVSLGATRKFKLKHLHQSELKCDVELKTGSLLIMSGKIQDYWKHCLPKALTVHDPRINITFRQITI